MDPVLCTNKLVERGVLKHYINPDVDGTIGSLKSINDMMSKLYELKQMGFTIPKELLKKATKEQKMYQRLAVQERRPTTR